MDVDEFILLTVIGLLIALAAWLWGHIIYYNNRNRK